MPKPSVKASRILKVSDDEFIIADDLLAAEEPLEIRIGYGSKENRIQKSISVTMRTPGNDFELVLGFLFTEGVIRNIDNIASIRYCLQNNVGTTFENIVNVELKQEVDVDIDKLSRNFYTSSSCGVCGKTSIESVKVACTTIMDTNDFSVSHSMIFSLPELLRKQQSVFEHTGGLHAAALFNSDGKLLMLREDVGRHNALDKLIGAGIASKSFMFENLILLLSGRASFELIQKAAIAGIRVIAAVGAPSSLAVQLAEEMNITLIGFLRNNRFNIYSCKERIKVTDYIYKVNA